MKVLVVVDMQNDFITGSLGTKEAQTIVPNVVKKIKEYYSKNYEVIYTKDTHHSNYLWTEEGKHLPIEHCIEGTKGWLLEPSVIELLDEDYDKKWLVSKKTFGAIELNGILNRINAKYEHKKLIKLESVELVGLCTDICVIANAIICKSTLPDVPIIVDASCCAGTTPDAHNKAIDLMKNSLQIKII